MTRLNGLLKTSRKSVLLSALILTGFLASHAIPAKAETLDDILAAKTIKIGVPGDFAPFGVAGSDLKPIGYDVDMANLIGRELGVKTELVIVSSPNRIPYLQTHKVDLIISTLGKNPEREKVLDFSDQYAPFFSGIYGLKGIAIKSYAELAGKTVGATRGNLEEIELTNNAPTGVTIKRYEDNNATIAAYASGQVDILSTGNTIIPIIADKVPDRAPELKFMIKLSPCYVGLNKDEPKLLAKVNEIIAKAKASGEIEKMSEKWLKAPLPAGF